LAEEDLYPPLGDADKNVPCFPFGFFPGDIEQRAISLDTRLDGLGVRAAPFGEQALTLLAKRHQSDFTVLANCFAQGAEGYIVHHFQP
jgi:hypothetical protein